jgi:hypothetical protein
VHRPRSAVRRSSFERQLLPGPAALSAQPPGSNADHRQAHHGCFAIAGEDAGGWTVVVDGKVLSIDKTSI